MAQVPQPRGLSVAPNAAPVPTQSLNAPALAFGANVAAEGLSALSKSVGAAADSMAEHALTMQAITNKTEADQRTIGYTEAADRITLDFQNNNRGLAAETNLASAYDALEQARTAAADGLSPDAQLAYNAASRQQLFRAQSTIRGFAVTERKAAVVGTANASVKLEQAQAAANPEYTPTAVAKIAEQWAFKSRPDVMGLTAEQAELGMREDIGEIFAGQIKVAIDTGDYPAAEAIFDEHKDNMTLPQVNSVSGAMKVGRNAYEATSAADEFFAGRGAEATAPSGDPLAALKSAAPGAKVTSTLRTPAHNAAVGGVPNSDHLTGQAADFVPAPGQTMAQLAASLRTAGIGEVIPEANHVHVEWGKGAGAKQYAPTAVPTTDPEEYALKADAAAEAFVDARFGHNPVLREQAYRTISARINRETATLRLEATQRYQRLGGAVLDGSLQDPSALTTAYPGAANDLANLTPTQRNALNSAMKSNANEMTPIRENNLAILEGRRINNPTAFAQTDLSKVELPANHRLALMKQQQATAAKTTKIVQSDTAVKQALTTPSAVSALNALVAGGGERAVIKDQFTGALSVEMDNYINTHGKPPVAGSKDMAMVVSQVTAMVGRTKNWHLAGVDLGFGAEAGTPAFAVPENMRGKIQDALREENLNPDDERLIGQRYRMFLNAK